MWYVLGAGAVGSLWCHHLRKQSHQVTVLLRNQERLFALRNKQYQITLELLSGCGVPEISHTEVCANGAKGGVFHLGEPVKKLLVTTKAPDTVAALQSIKHSLNPTSVVVLLQNGVLGVYDRVVREVFPNEEVRPRFVLGSTTHGCYLKAPFHVVHAGVGNFCFGVLERDCHGDKSLLDEVAGDLLELKDLAPQMKTEIEMLVVLRSKLVINCCVNPLTALLMVRNGDLCDNVAVQQLQRAVAEECQRALGLTMDLEELLKMVTATQTATSNNFSSMYMDMKRGRPTEIDYLNGYVVDTGAGRGVPCPVNRTLVSLITAKQWVDQEMV